MPFQIPTYDALLSTILIDYQNEFPQADVSQGSLIFIKSACLASALWGAYKYQEYILNQAFPETADTENLDHHGFVRNVSRLANETDAAYLARILEYLRRPPAGGNKYDYEKWAKESTNVAAAYCYPNGQGLGTVDVLIMADETATGSETASSHTQAGANTSLTAYKLKNSGANFLNAANLVRPGDVVNNTSLGTSTTVVTVDSATQLTLASDIFTATPQNYEIISLVAQVQAHLDLLRPAGSRLVRTVPSPIDTQNIVITVTGSNANRPKIITDITNFVSTLAPNTTLYQSQLVSICVVNGAASAVVTTPAADVVPALYHTIRPGTVTLN